MSIETIIPGEIKSDELSAWIERLAATDGVNECLDIGASSGEGSTSAIVRGAMKNPRSNLQPCRVWALEVSQPRFIQLEHWASNQQILIRTYRMASTPVLTMMSEKDVREFYAEHGDLNITKKHTIEEVIGWLNQDRDYVTKSGIPQNGVDFIMGMRKGQPFGLAVCDGSAFAGMADVLMVRGSRYISLDDTEDIKMWDANQMISSWPEYKLLAENKTLRNGYAIWELK